MELRARASRWYREPAEAYFEAQRRRLDELLKQHEQLSDQIGGELSPGCEELLQSACGDAAGAVAAFLRDETEKIETGLYAMPEKGLQPKIPRGKDDSFNYCDSGRFS